LIITYIQRVAQEADGCDTRELARPFPLSSDNPAKCSARVVHADIPVQWLRHVEEPIGSDYDLIDLGEALLWVVDATDPGDRNCLPLRTHGDPVMSIMAGHTEPSAENRGKDAAQVHFHFSEVVNDSSSDAGTGVHSTYVVPRRGTTTPIEA
jgi:hypothetical protein